MRRLLLPILALAALFTPAASAAARLPAACATQRPVALTFTRAPGRTAGTLHWRAGRGAPAHSRYRVWRNHLVVGQTTAHQMHVNVSLDRRYTLRVRLVTAAGRILACNAPVLHISTAYRLPSVPLFVSASGGGQSVRLSWQRSTPGDGGLAGYRVLRNGAVYAQTRATSMTVRVASNHTYTFSVMAVDRHGRHSAPSHAVRMLTDHSAPGAPGGLSGSAGGPTTVTLSWQPGQQTSGPIAGYRVLRDGKPLGQYHATTVTVGNLTPSTSYQYSVQTVDTLGYVSGATAPVTVRTTAPGAPTAPTALLGAPLNDSTVELSWQPSVAAQGRITGYRILRNGTPIGEYQNTMVTIGNLFPSTTYTFTVVAIDSLGDQSDSSASVAVRTADPTPTSGHVYAFLLADTGQSFTDFENHYQEIGTVAPTFYDCNHSTTLSGANVGLITQWAQARQVRVVPRFNCQSTNVLDQMLHSPTMEQTWIDYIVGQVTANNFDGATVDFEAGPAADRGLYTTFITNLAAQLHAAGKLLILCVSAKTADVQNNPRSTFFDYNSLSSQVDDMFVMAWGIHWATSAPGAQDDMTWVTQVVHYISTLPRVNKYILGMQLYAMDWANGGGSANPAATYEYSGAEALAQQMGATPVLNPTSDALTFSYTDTSGVHHDVWFTNAQTEADRITLAHQNGLGGVGVWRLGQEDQNLWSDSLLTGSW